MCIALAVQVATVPHGITRVYVPTGFLVGVLLWGCSVAYGFGGIRL